MAWATWAEHRNLPPGGRAGGKIVCVNPLTWLRDGPRASAALHKGAVPQSGRRRLQHPTINLRRYGKGRVDAEFQSKCINRMSEVAGSGRTVLFVSHNLTAVSKLCSRCILLSGGKLVADGSTAR